MRTLALLIAMAGAAQAQFRLFSVNGSAESAVPPVFDFGQVISGDLRAVQFRVRNTSASPASIYSMALAGSGFLFQNAPALPQTVAPQGTLDFQVKFQADAAGSYSAGMTLPGVSVILTATVAPGLLFRAPSPMDFGTVAAGTASIIDVSVENHSSVPLATPSLAISGAGFSLIQPPPGGFVLQPLQTVGFEVQFAPAAAGSYAGLLKAGNVTFALAGTGFEPAPQVVISVDLPQPASGQQGTVTVTLASSARLAGGGTLQLDFDGPSDPAVALAIGGRLIGFKIIAGQTKLVTSQFQTGTTAGNLIFTVTLGEAKVRQTVAIAPAAVAIAAAQATRSTGAVTLQLTGFDNTRSAGAMVFDFYDRNGNPIPPSPIAATADFASFFQTSGLGGQFLLNAVFPVNGDPSQIAAFDVQVTNAAGVAKSARTSF